MENFSDNHAIHGLGLGVFIFLLTQKPALGLLIGGGSFLWMRKFGHRTNVTFEEVENIFK
jgi:hypothetical protein